MQMKLKLTVAAAVAAVAGMAAAQDVQVVKIGHVAPMSGSQAHYGKDNENGVRMAIEDLNAQNVTIGGKKIKFELVAEDDAADPKQGTAAAQKLCDAKVAGVVGHLNSGTTIPASKVYNDCGIPQITPSATNPNLTKPGYKTTFRLWPTTTPWAPAWRCYAADTLKLKSVAIIDDRTAYGQGVAEVFKKTAQSKGMKVVDEQYTNDKATDFMAILTAIKSKNPDAIFYGGMDPQAGPMLRQMEQLGMTNVKFFGGDGICTDRDRQAGRRRQDAGQRGLRRRRRFHRQDARRHGLEEALRRQVPGPVPGLQPVHLRRHVRAGRRDEARQLGRPEGLHCQIAQDQLQGRDDHGRSSSPTAN